MCTDIQCVMSAVFRVHMCVFCHRSAVGSHSEGGAEHRQSEFTPAATAAQPSIIFIFLIIPLSKTLSHLPAQSVIQQRHIFNEHGVFIRAQRDVSCDAFNFSKATQILWIKMCETNSKADGNKTGGKI